VKADEPIFEWNQSDKIISARFIVLKLDSKSNGMFYAFIISISSWSQFQCASANPHSLKKHPRSQFKPIHWKANCPALQRNEPKRFADFNSMKLSTPKSDRRFPISSSQAAQEKTFETQHFPTSRSAISVTVSLQLLHLKANIHCFDSERLIYPLATSKRSCEPFHSIIDSISVLTASPVVSHFRGSWQIFIAIASGSCFLPFSNKGITLQIPLCDSSCFVALFCCTISPSLAYYQIWDNIAPQSWALLSTIAEWNLKLCGVSNLYVNYALSCGSTSWSIPFLLALSQLTLKSG
jgi:hypothetical protein